MAKPTDKRVFELSVRDAQTQAARLLAIGADSTILDLYLAALGAFNWRGDYDAAEFDYRVIIDRRVYERGKGSRTALRRVLDAGTRAEFIASGMHLEAEVTKTYEVSSRRHYPKVLETGGDASGVQIATWDAQAAMRRQFRGRAARLADWELRDQTEAREHGYFTAIVSGPLLMPRVWLPRLVDFQKIPDMETAQTTLAGVMERYNEVARALHADQKRFMSTVESFADRGNGNGVLAWCAGYFDGVDLCIDEWESLLRDEDVRKLFEPIFVAHFQCGRDPQKRTWLDDPKFRADLAHACALAAIGLREAWRQQLAPPNVPVRRSQPKISPNEPCPCGSGKKYKRCCGSPLRLVEG